MGTEKRNIELKYKRRLRNGVKLNNPLMGTEKHCSFCNKRIKSLYLVKLNNPLMGTENLEVTLYIALQYICLLN